MTHTRDKLRQDVIDDSLNIINPSQAKLVGYGFDQGIAHAIAQADRLAEALMRIKFGYAFEVGNTAKAEAESALAEYAAWKKEL